MSLRLLPQSLSILRSIGWSDERKQDPAAQKQGPSPTLTLRMDKDIYRPGDVVIATIDICSPTTLASDGEGTLSGDNAHSLLVDGLSFELKGMEKLDGQWFYVQKLPPGSNQRRGEHLFMDCTAPSFISKVIVPSGQTKTFLVRIELPKILPPSYRGTSIRYIYYARSTMYGRWFTLDSGHQPKGHGRRVIKLEARIPLQIWVSQTGNLLNEEGNLVVPVDYLSIYWREKDEDSEWTLANDSADVLDDGSDSSRDDALSVSSRANPEFSLRNSLSAQSLATRLSTNELYPHGERTNFPSYSPLPELSVSEVLEDYGRGSPLPLKKLNHSLSDASSSERRASSVAHLLKDDLGLPITPKHAELSTSEGYSRGRSYNIRIDDKVLLRYSPKNSNSSYYFGDTIGGTLTFFHGDGGRKCLEVSITLETLETVSQHVIHPSRRGSPAITKVHSEHHEVVVDLCQTSFLFSLPIEGPMSFSTPKVSVQWSLRFEFFTTEGLDLARYEHPLLVEKRERGDWTLPITVCAPPVRRQITQSRNENFPMGNFIN